MITGIAVLAVFAFLWADGGLILVRAPWIAGAVPLLVSVMLFVAARRRLAGVAPRNPEDGRRIGRLVMIWSAIEGVMIFVGINIAYNLNRPDLTMAAGCAAVGLHFIPLARGIPQPPFYVTGLGLIALAATGIADSAVVTPPMIGFGAALILWCSIILLLVRVARSAP